MQAGKLKRRVTFQVKGVSRDSFGQPVETWSKVRDCYADIQPLSGREMIAANATQSEVTHQVIVRYATAFASSVAVCAMRILYGSRILNIRSYANVNEANREIRLLCTEGDNNG